MTPERFQQIEELYEALCTRTGEERAALLTGTDPELRRELESLLAQRSGGELLDGPAIPSTMPLLENLTLTQTVATSSLGPYRIESKLGEGGMGEVFRAVDTRLGRAVAIKTAREQFSARFEREARAISSLNHPNICTVHDVGPNYFVMELVEGPTLAAVLQSGPLAVKTALLYGSQILAALVEAHGKGIVHRDLKPGNIMIAKSGIKVVDFGLAKSGVDETVTSSEMVMGTPAYMAPEQRHGKLADARTDIYSFGCVLYEMLTGRRVTAQRSRVPSRRLEKIVHRCLEEDPARRWQSAAELDRELAKAAGGAGPWKALAAAAALAAMLAAGYAYFQRPPKLTEKDTIVLAEFDNRTGDPVFDGTLREGLSVELQQSPYLALISDRTVQQALTLMGRPKDGRLTPEIAQMVCERTGGAAVLEGSIALVGSQYVLRLRAKECATGNLLDQQQAVATRREEVLNALSEMSRKFRSRAGESLATVEKHSMPLSEATTPSFEALKAYSSATKLSLTSGSNERSIPLLRRAIEIDPNFAMAYARLGFAYGIKESTLSAEYATQAWLLRNRVSDRERFYIDFTYHRQVTGNLEKAYNTLELWSQTYPRRAPAVTNAQDLLGGISTQGTGRFERTIEAALDGIAHDPGIPHPHSNLALAQFYTDRFAAAEQTLQRAAARKVTMPQLPMLQYSLAALKGDREQMDRIARATSGNRAAEHWIAHAEALALARSGRLQAARRPSERAADTAMQAGEPEMAASLIAARAVWEALCGNAAEARTDAMAALELSTARDVEYAAGLALALAGSPARSEALAADLEKRLPEDTFAKFTYAPVLRASASLAKGRFADSLERLATARSYELAVNGLNFPYLILGGLHSAYMRGSALIALRRYAEAEAEFQKILARRGLVGLDPIGALAHLQLGRVLALSGDKSRAKAAYEAFLAAWKEADPDVPILKTAKAEYGKL